MEKYKLLIISMTIVLAAMFSHPVTGQVLEIKKWKGRYPDMDGSYPLTFIAFKGGWFPVPYTFVRTWPTHYYMEVGSKPTIDAAGIAESTASGLLKIAAKMLERKQMKGRYNETLQIKGYAGLQKDIREIIFNSRDDELDDIYGIAESFIELYKKIDKIKELSATAGTENVYEEEAGRLLSDFLMVNLLGADHGQKLQSFSEINKTLKKFIGEVDYAYIKIVAFNNFSEEISSYSFLAQ